MGEIHITPFAVLSVPVLLFAIVVHEVAHGLVAYWGGDDTASLQGRLTLNPLAHIDPIGTVIIPLVGMLTGFPLIGWAKPVPVNPLRLKNSTWDVYVSLAGPASNFLQVFLATFLLLILRLTKPGVYPYGFSTHEPLTVVSGIMALLALAVIVNTALALFNLIPLPPLDGHWVVNHYFLRPGNWIDQFYTAIQPYSYFVILGLFYVFGKYFAMVIFGIANLFFSVIPGL